MKVVKGLLDNTNEENYKTSLQEVLKSYQPMGCRLWLKRHFLHNRSFSENLGAVSNEQAESFYTDIKMMETQYRPLESSNDERLLLLCDKKEALTPHKRKK